MDTCCFVHGGKQAAGRGGSTPFLCGGERIPQPGMAPAEGGWRAPASRVTSQPEQRIGGARVLARMGRVANTGRGLLLVRQKMSKTQLPKVARKSRPRVSSTCACFLCVRVVRSTRTHHWGGLGKWPKAQAKRPKMRHSRSCPGEIYLYSCKVCSRKALVARHEACGMQMQSGRRRSTAHRFPCRLAPSPTLRSIPCPRIRLPGPGGEEA